MFYLKRTSGPQPHADYTVAQSIFRAVPSYAPDLSVVELPSPSQSDKDGVQVCFADAGVWFGCNVITGLLARLTVTITKYSVPFAVFSDVHVCLPGGHRSLVPS